MARGNKFWAGAFLVVAVAGSLTATAVPSQAAPGKPTSTAQATPVVVATGLDNPRGLQVLPDGSVLIAVTGSGPTTSCPVPPANSVTRCLGFTGSIYRVKGATKGNVATGLPSEEVVHPDGSTGMSGANDVLPGTNGTYTVLYGLGGIPADRTALGAGSGPLGTVSLSDGTLVGDLTEYEFQQGLDVPGIVTDPWNFAKEGTSYLVTDAGSNDLFKVTPNGTITTVFEFPDNVTASGKQVQAVPTGIVRARDGSFYIGDMSGDAPGISRIWHYVPGQQPTELTTGLTDVIALDLTPDGNLVALSFGTTAPTGNGVPGPGALTLINTSTGALTPIDTGDVLSSPTGMGVAPDGDIYVVNNAITTNGELLKFRGAAN